MPADEPVLAPAEKLAPKLPRLLAPPPARGPAPIRPPDAGDLQDALRQRRFRRLTQKPHSLGLEQAQAGLTSRALGGGTGRNMVRAKSAQGGVQMGLTSAQSSLYLHPPSGLCLGFSYFDRINLDLMLRPPGGLPSAILLCWAPGNGNFFSVRLPQRSGLSWGSVHRRNVQDLGPTADGQARRQRQSHAVIRFGFPDAAPPHIALGPQALQLAAPKLSGHRRVARDWSLEIRTPTAEMRARLDAHAADRAAAWRFWRHAAPPLQLPGEADLAALLPAPGDVFTCACVAASCAGLAAQLRCAILGLDALRPLNLSRQVFLQPLLTLRSLTSWCQAAPWSLHLSGQRQVAWGTEAEVRRAATALQLTLSTHRRQSRYVAVVSGLGAQVGELVTTYRTEASAFHVDVNDAAGLAWSQARLRSLSAANTWHQGPLQLRATWFPRLPAQPVDAEGPAPPASAELVAQQVHEGQHCRHGASLIWPVIALLLPPEHARGVAYSLESSQEVSCLYDAKRGWNAWEQVQARTERWRRGFLGDIVVETSLRAHYIDRGDAPAPLPKAAEDLLQGVELRICTRSHRPTAHGLRRTLAARGPRLAPLFAADGEPTAARGWRRLSEWLGLTGHLPVKTEDISTLWLHVAPLQQLVADSRTAGASARWARAAEAKGASPLRAALLCRQLQHAGDEGATQRQALALYLQADRGCGVAGLRFLAAATGAPKAFTQQPRDELLPTQRLRQLDQDWRRALDLQAQLDLLPAMLPALDAAVTAMAQATRVEQILQRPATEAARDDLQLARATLLSHIRASLSLARSEPRILQASQCCWPGWRPWRQSAQGRLDAFAAACTSEADWQKIVAQQQSAIVTVRGILPRFRLLAALRRQLRQLARLRRPDAALAMEPNLILTPQRPTSGATSRAAAWLRIAKIRSRLQPLHDQLAASLPWGLRSVACWL